MQNYHHIYNVWVYVLQYNEIIFRNQWNRNQIVFKQEVKWTKENDKITVHLKEHKHDNKIVRLLLANMYNNYFWSSNLTRLSIDISTCALSRLAVSPCSYIVVPQGGGKGLCLSESLNRSPIQKHRFMQREMH